MGWQIVMQASMSETHPFCPVYFFPPALDTVNVLILQQMQVDEKELGLKGGKVLFVKSCEQQ